MIDDYLYDAFGQRQVSTMYTALNQYHVVMEVDPKYWQNPEGLKIIYVPTSNPAWCRSRPSPGSSPRPHPLTVNHQGQFPSVTISFNLPVGVALGHRHGRDQARRSGDPASGEHPRQLPGHGPGVPVVAGQRESPDPGGAPGRLHRARHPLREPDPSGDDPLDAALGRASGRSWRCSSSRPSSPSSP